MSWWGSHEVKHFFKQNFDTWPLEVKRPLISEISAWGRSKNMGGAKSLIKSRDYSFKYKRRRTLWSVIAPPNRRTTVSSIRALFITQSLMISWRLECLVPASPALSGGKEPKHCRPEKPRMVMRLLACPGMSATCQNTFMRMGQTSCTLK